MKIQDLAIFRGTPAFEEKLHVGRPNIGNREKLLTRINDLLDRRWLSNKGPYVQEFEQSIAALLSVKHCIAMCNATVALEITARAMGLREEVIVPSFTFIATAHAMKWLGITPVFGDIDPATHNLDPNKIEALITPHTTGILGVHVWGRPCAIEALSEIARRRNLKLIFDAAHAFGNSYQGQMIGNYGQAEVFSFHATKFLNAFEGGAVVTNDDDLAFKIRNMKNFGFVGYDNVISVGINGKMSEVSAAMGLTELESLDDYISINRRNYVQYRQELSGIPGVKLISFDDREKCNYQYIILEIEDKVTGINRDELVEIMHAENVLARRYFYPGCHQMEPYRSDPFYSRFHLPETEILCQKVLSLPNGSSIDDNKITKICGIIRFVIENGMVIKEMLKSNIQTNKPNR